MTRASRKVILAAVLNAAFVFGQGQRQQPPPPPPQKPPQSPAKEAPRKPASHKRLINDLSGFEMSDPNEVRKQRAVLGATRGSGNVPILLSPDLGKFYGVSALFAWTYRGKAAGFEIVLRDDDDNEVLRRQVGAHEFRLSGDSPRLHAGKAYYWSVRPGPSIIPSSSSAVAGFVVVSEGEATQIANELAAISQSDAYAAAVARARVLVNHRLWYDALGAYSDLIRFYPGRAELYEQRGTIYAQIEATRELADADFARADELQASEDEK